MRRYHWQFVSLKDLSRHLEDIHQDTQAGIVSVNYCRFWFRRSAFVVWWESYR